MIIREFLELLFLEELFIQPIAGQCFRSITPESFSEDLKAFR